MTDRDIEIKLLNYHKTLTLINMYGDDFLKSLGSEKALNDYIDEILDNINYLNKLKKDNGGKKLSADNFINSSGIS